MLCNKLLFFFAILVYGECQQSSQIDYYESLINQVNARVETFTLPTDGSRYKPTDESATPIDFGLWDFIIVGGGTTGSVIASRLSEKSKWNILVLEAGNFGAEYIIMPGMAYQSALTDYNWNYESVPQANACQGMIDKICPIPRGLGMGGSSLINACIYFRGHPNDYNKWAAMGNPGWSYAEVLPYFLKSENYTKRGLSNVPTAAGFHNTNGPYHVEYPLPQNAQLDAFLGANAALGYQSVDPNGPVVVGYSPTPLATNDGTRQDLATVYIKPVLSRSNLVVSTQSFVTKVNINKITKIANSVEFTKNGKKYIAYVKKEIIMSAGAIGTPQILMLSGIGPQAHLQTLGIPVINNLDVGSTLRDHLQYFGLIFQSNASVGPQESLRDYVAEFLNGVGPLSMAGPSLGNGFYQTDNEPIPGYNDIQLLLITSNTTSDLTNRVLRWTDETWDAMYGDVDHSSTFTLSIALLHPRSSGTVRLKSSSPYDYPLINPNFLSDTDGVDMSTVYKAIQIAMNLIDTEPFRRINATYAVKTLEACKNYEYLSKDYWYCYIRQLSFHIFHPQCTCPMGLLPSEGAVVNARLGVHGIKRLRVADASIFPLSISGPPMAVCVMVGEKASDILKEDYVLL